MHLMPPLDVTRTRLGTRAMAGPWLAHDATGGVTDPRTIGTWPRFRPYVNVHTGTVVAVEPADEPALNPHELTRFAETFWRTGVRLLARADPLPEGTARVPRRARTELMLRDRDIAGPAPLLAAGTDSLFRLDLVRPDLLLLEPDLIDGITSGPARKSFIAALVHAAHALGVKVAATGIASETQFWACREIGCDIGQGDWIAPPTACPARIATAYALVPASNRRDRRCRGYDVSRLLADVDRVPPLSATSSLDDMLHAFARGRTRRVIPVVNAGNQPVGVVDDADLKTHLYTRAGRQLLEQQAGSVGIAAFIAPCLVCDTSMRIEQILAVVAARGHETSVVITDAAGYVGMLDPSLLLRIMHERSLTQARNQNPLTRLPGNVAITDHIAAALEDSDCALIFAQFDLDHFKPFNDRFGFRQGDRAILTFATLAQRHFGGREAFIGHIGGDDFFLGLRDVEVATATERVRALIAAFTQEAAAFYSAAERDRGTMQAIGRDGVRREFPLLSVSCALLDVPARSRRGATPAPTVECVSNALAELKKAAKSRPDRLVTGTLGRLA